MHRPCSHHIKLYIQVKDYRYIAKYKFKKRKEKYGEFMNWGLYYKVN